MEFQLRGGCMTTLNLGDPGLPILSLIPGDVLILPAVSWKLISDQEAVVIAKSPDTNKVALTNNGQLIDYRNGDEVYPTRRRKDTVCLEGDAERLYWTLFHKSIWIPQRQNYVLLEQSTLQGVRVVSENISPNPPPEPLRDGTVVSFSHTEAYQGQNTQCMDLFHFYRVVQDGRWAGAILQVRPGATVETLMHPI